MKPSASATVSGPRTRASKRSSRVVEVRRTARASRLRRTRLATAPRMSATTATVTAPSHCHQSRPRGPGFMRGAGKCSRSQGISRTYHNPSSRPWPADPS